MKTATAGQHATLAIHSVKDAQTSYTAAARDEHKLSSRSLMKVKEAVKESDVAHQTSSMPATAEPHQTEPQNLRSDPSREQSQGPIEGNAHRPHSEDDTTQSTLPDNSPAGHRGGPLRKEMTDRRHDIWQCSTQAGSPFRAVAGSQSSGGSAQGRASSSHSGDSDQFDSPRYHTPFLFFCSKEEKEVIHVALSSCMRRILLFPGRMSYNWVELT